MTEWFEKFPEKWWLGDKKHITESQVRFIIRTLKLHKGQSMLDAPCGDGELAIHLAERGIHITGIDLTRRFILRAKRRFRQKSLSGEFHVMDLRHIDFEHQFDAVCNWFGSFGYFSDRVNLDVLRRFARALKRGGRLLIHQTNREYMRRHPIPRYQYEDFIRTTRWDKENERYEMMWSRLFDAKRKYFRVSQRYYTPRQFHHLFTHAGLKVTAIYGGWNSEQYQRGSHYIVVVSEK